MRIKHFTCYEVIVPANAGVIESESIHKPLHKLPVGIKSGWSMQFDELPKLLVKMELDSGVVGWGELYRDHNWTVVEGIIQSLLGKDIREICLQKLPFNFCREYDGFECAIWDAYARAHNLQVVDLLGGAVQKKVKVGAWSSHRTLDEIGQLAAGFAQQGYDCLKFKTDLEDDVTGWCQEIKKAAPGMQVILDPNERWLYPGEVRKRARALEEVGNVLCLEDPLPRWMLSEYALLRQFSAVPVVLHVSLPYILHGQRIKDAIQALNAKAVDGFNFNGGLANFQRLDHIANAAGLPCWHGSEVDLGILEAMYVHSAAAAESCIWPSDIFGRLIRSHDLLTTPLKIEPPFVHLPEGPGLGVTPDEEAIGRFLKQQKEFK
ncbi:mandelate racemase/muconate lactonizing enzyme family protein [Fulvivirgaceae bacterium BMA12]|uniref:Mandelate racemase/muconate lactonizing enzyme family protein n=1 Tax=Agaribacillus aureus TaxID=3051825 RepID=A0ABT8L9Z1_9BACT|nr:mandelate racemase/muconate lactonizing enzyme family protein [Fulvivirgaceae bacterium BMA12]